MKMRRRKLLLVIAASALISGGTAAVLLSRAAGTDAAVDADINAHFANTSVAMIEKDNDVLDAEVISSAPSALKTRSAGSARTTPKKDTGKKKNSGAAGQRHHAVKFSVPGIEPASKGAYFIDRALFDDARRNPGNYVGGARATPSKRGADIEGFLVSGTSEGYLQAIGLCDGDILLAVNGHPLSSAKNVSLATASVMRSTQFRVDLRRNGTPMSLYYRLK